MKYSQAAKVGKAMPKATTPIESFGVREALVTVADGQLKM